LFLIYYDYYICDNKQQLKKTINNSTYLLSKPIYLNYIALPICKILQTKLLSSTYTIKNTDLQIKVSYTLSKNNIILSVKEGLAKLTYNFYSG